MGLSKILKGCSQVSTSITTIFHGGPVEYFIPMANTGQRRDSHHQLEGMFKKVRPARPRIA
jgi:hypothetical protein